MDGWQIGRLLTAAEIDGHFLKLRLAILMRGDDPWLLLQVLADPDVQVDDDYARWSPGFRAQVPADWPSGAGNPWLACAYSGRLETMTVLELERLITDVSDGGKRAGTRLTALIAGHLDDAALDLKTKRMLVRFLKKDFESVAISTLVRPVETDDGYELTLRSAYEIHQAVSAGKRLNATQRRQAAVLLKYAPWQFGYWGPFKSLVKSVPAGSLADAYAVAIARLSSTDGAVEVPPARVAIEGVDELEGWFGIPSKRTQQYLARRVRRDLASVADQSPEVYARVATRMLISWDQPLSNYSYAPAFVMLGARSPLDSRSRYVHRPADMADRRDPHPETWNSRAELAFRVFRSIRKSVEALTWAFEVLDSTGATPELPTASIALGLQSAYPPLRQLACSTLPRRPKLFDALTEDQWAAFLRHGSDADVQAITRAMANRQTPTNLFDALGPLLALAAPPSDRRTHLALLYLRAQKGSNGLRDDAEVSAVTAVIQSSGSKQQSLWGPVVAGMREPAVLRLYRSLVESGVTGAPLDTVGNELLKAHYLDPGLIVDCLASDSDKVVDLGRRIVESRGGRQFLFTQVLRSVGYGFRISSDAVTRFVKETLQQVAEPQDAVALVRWSLSAGIGSRALTRLLSGNRLGIIAIWYALASEKDGRIARWVEETPDVIPLIAETLATEQLDEARPTQLRPMLNYVGKNPGKLDHEERVRLVAIRSADPKLQADAFQQLRRARGLQRNWLTVAESGFPAGVDAVRKYLESIKGKAQVRRAILECLASGSSRVQDMGVQLFRNREALADDPEILAALGRSGDRLAQNLVAEAAAAGVPVDRAALADFDRRILTGRQASPRARELVKKRLETEAVVLEPNSAERIAAVVQMARSGNKGDREWALIRLAMWALHGAVIEGLEVSLTTEGVVGLEDVAP